MSSLLDEDMIDHRRSATSHRSHPRVRLPSPQPLLGSLDGGNQSVVSVKDGRNLVTGAVIVANTVADTVANTVADTVETDGRTVRSRK